MKSSKGFIISYSCFLIMLGLSGLTIITPGLPIIKTDLHTTNVIIKSSLTLYLAGYGISQLIYGPLSDQHGRKPIIIAALVLFLIGNFFSFLSHNGPEFLIGHTIAGFGAGIGSCAPRAIFKDSFQGKSFTSTLVYIMMSASVGSGLAPFLGGLILKLAGWRSIFIFFIVLTLLLIVVTFLLFPETNANKRHVSSTQILRDYSQLLRHKIFFGNAVYTGISFGLTTAYLAVTPFIYQSKLGLTPDQNGLISIPMLLSLFAGGILFKRYIINISNRFAAYLGIIFSLSGGIFLLIISCFHWLNVTTLLIPVMLIYIGTGVSGSAVVSDGLADFSHIAGTAGAFQGSLKVLITCVCAFAASLIGQQTALPLSTLLIALVFVMMITYFFCCILKPRVLE